MPVWWKWITSSYLETCSKWLSYLDTAHTQALIVKIIMWNLKYGLRVSRVTREKAISSHNVLLTHWGRDKTASIFLTFSNAFSWMKMYQFRSRFHWSLFARVQLIISQHWFRWWLGAVQATSHYHNRWWVAYWRIYASLGPNEFRPHNNIVSHKLLLDLSLICQAHNGLIDLKIQWDPGEILH